MEPLPHTHRAVGVLAGRATQKCSSKKTGAFDQSDQHGTWNPEAFPLDPHGPGLDMCLESHAGKAEVPWEPEDKTPLQ